MTVRTRFAPSPTGYLHIGGVRTALFNWLFARKHGGQFLLRVDDTDAQRNVDAALAPILHGFKWLGLDWDEGPEVGGPHAPYYQSQRSQTYQAAVEQLLGSGHAYRDFATTEEIQAEREAAQQSGAQFTYSRRWMAETDADAERFRADGRQSVVRLKMPREGELVINDLVREEVRFPWAGEQDHVIQRADGTCLYHLASVVDDHDMQISHVIRAEEHLSNTPRQIFICQSLGYPLPEYAHLPYVAEPGSKNKLSKRKLDKYLKNKEFQKAFDHGINVATSINRQLKKYKKFIESQGESEPPQVRQQIMQGLQPTLLQMLPEFSKNSVIQFEMQQLILSNAAEFFGRPEFLAVYERSAEIQYKLGVIPDPSAFNPVILDFYESSGYLPHAILNYLLLLGWSLDDRTEEFSLGEMIKCFSLERVVKSPASFDPQKLFAFQDREMQKLPLKQKVAFVLPFLQQAALVSTPPSCDIAPYLSQIVEAAGDRIKVGGDILDYDDFFTSDDKLEFDEKTFDKRLRKAAGAPELLTEFRAILGEVQPFDAATLEQAMKSFVEQKGIKIGDVVHAVRVAVTGKGVGFGLFETLAILGRERCLSRIDRALARL